MVMDKVGNKVAKYPLITIAIVLIVTLLSVSSIAINGINQEFSEESFMPDMEIVQASEEVSEKFTSTRSVSILVKSKDNDVLTSDDLVEILEVEKKLLNDSLIVSVLENPDVPSVNINSVADIIASSALQQQGILSPTYDQKISALKNLNDSDIKLLIGSILASNQTPAQVKFLFEMILTKDFKPTENIFKAKGTLITISLNASIMEIGPMSSSDGSKISEAEVKMDDIVKKSNLKETEISVMGESIIMNEIMDATNESMSILLPLAFIFVIIILAIIYRNGFDMLISLLALVFAIIWVYGFGSILGFTFNPITTAVPVLIVGLGIDYGIHITMRYREEIKKGKKIDQAIIITIMSVGMALLLATVTTVVSFLSNVASPIGLLGEFGILCAIGIIASFIIMITLVPACKMLRDKRRLKKGKLIIGNDNSNNKTQKIKKAGVTALSKAMGTGAVAAEKHPLIVIIVVFLLTVGAGSLALQINTEFDFEDFLPEELDISKDLNYMLNEFSIAGGEAQEADILVKGDISDPGLLRDIGKTIENTEDDKAVLATETNSILNIMQDWATNMTNVNPLDVYSSDFEFLYNQSMTSEGVPKESATKQNITYMFMWLYNNPFAVKSVKNVLHMSDDNSFDSTVIRLKVDVETNDGEAIETLYKQLKADKKPLEESSDEVTVTSGPILTKILMDTLNDSQTRSLIITIIISLIVLTIVFWYKWKSFILGAITITPVVFCVIWTFAAMYLTDTALNVMTITIASLTIGLGITYGIHITHRFLEDLKYFDYNVDEACLNTVTHTGTALFGAAATTIGGFGILVFALLPPIQQFGGITALTILFSFLASVFVLPTFLVLWAKHRFKNKK